MKTKILMTGFVTHDVKRFIISKPKNYRFIPGQATEVSISKENLKDKKRPFTFTSLDEDLVLELTIKEYLGHEGITREFDLLKSGDELIIGKPFGAISYKGKGVFIAGGTGVTPFIAIFRQLKKDGRLKENKLIFSNKTNKDIIYEKELKEILKENLILTLTREKNKNYENRRINKEFLKEYIKNFNQYFYICGPKNFVKDINNILKEIGVKPNLIIFEK